MQCMREDEFNVALSDQKHNFYCLFVLFLDEMSSF